MPRAGYKAGLSLKDNVGNVRPVTGYPASRYPDIRPNPMDTQGRVPRAGYKAGLSLKDDEFVL